ncbi:Arv1 protein [Cynara cardunculus var. scolymus]|uniref:Protein ARV n=1 Tax=Cynara cardunculus var. scolymus TaxID=59895 RepID=A0A124SHG8_CYNCS|nr:Arv1 protein [Cynara cardunculus var. scolymus]
MNFRCVQCGYHIKILYVQYSPGNIRLMKCKNCRAVADEYIECEIMILLIDLILHKAKAYRHLFYNMFDREAMNFEILLDTFLGNLSFIGILLLGTRSLLNMPVEVSGYKNILLAILASSYLKMFLIAMMVWEFPSSVIFIIDIFVLSSNTLALKVMSEESAMAKCFGVCFCAHVVKFLISLALNIHLPKLITRMLTL